MFSVILLQYLFYFIAHEATQLQKGQYMCVRGHYTQTLFLTRLHGSFLRRSATGVILYCVLTLSRDLPVTVCIITLQCSYASAVLRVVILSVCLCAF